MQNTKPDPVLTFVDNAINHPMRGFFKLLLGPILFCSSLALISCKIFGLIQLSWWIVPLPLLFLILRPIVMTTRH